MIKLLACETCRHYDRNNWRCTITRQHKAQNYFCEMHEEAVTAEDVKEERAAEESNDCQWR